MSALVFGAYSVAVIALATKFHNYWKVCVGLHFVSSTAFENQSLLGSSFILSITFLEGFSFAFRVILLSKPRETVHHK